MEEMDLEKLVVQPTWRDLLMNLVVEEKLDPWNIDIIQVTEKYLERIRNLQSVDLRIPANIILAAAILLRFKSETLKLEEEQQVVEEEVYIGDEPASEIPVLSLKTRIPPKRRVSLGELINTLSEVIEAQKKRAEKAFKPKPIMSIEIPKEDIEKRMKDLFERVQNRADSEGMLMFSDLLEKRNSHETIMMLLPLLHLAQDRKIDIMQEKMFGDIFIRILREKHGTTRPKKNN